MARSGVRRPSQSASVRPRRVRDDGARSRSEEDSGDDRGQRSAGSFDRLDSRPLYAQAYAEVVKRIASGAWPPGCMLPSEFDLAAELGIAPGTLRKALDDLARDGVLVRRQGRGTFVREETPAAVLFRFFRIFGDGGRQVVPNSRNVSVATGRANREERARLALAPHTEVVRIERVRFDGADAFIAERIALPADMFPGLASLDPIPNTLYDLFQRRFAVTVSRADERITIEPATEHDAHLLALPAGTPLLVLDRTTFALDGRAIEWRVSRCHMAGRHYLASMR